METAFDNMRVSVALKVVDNSFMFCRAVGQSTRRCGSVFGILGGDAERGADVVTRIIRHNDVVSQPPRSSLLRALVLEMSELFAPPHCRPLELNNQTPMHIG